MTVYYEKFSQENVKRSNYQLFFDICLISGTYRAKPSNFFGAIDKMFYQKRNILLILNADNDNEKGPTDLSPLEILERTKHFYCWLPSSFVSHSCKLSK